MDLQQLLFLFRDDTRTQELLQHLQPSQARVLLRGTIGSSVNFIAASVFMQSDFTHVIVLETMPKTRNTYKTIYRIY
jgi:hypothetical protein